MAHADYACCAVCDRKLYYSHNAPTKEEICQECTAAKALGADEALIQQHSRVQVDWRKVALALDPPEDVKAQYASAGELYVSLKLEV